MGLLRRRRNRASLKASPEFCKKSNSTGFSKVWRFRDLVHRSNSDGKERGLALCGLVPSGSAERERLLTGWLVVVIGLVVLMELAGFGVASIDMGMYHEAEVTSSNLLLVDSIAKCLTFQGFRSTIDTIGQKTVRVSQMWG
ncbi:hypothetical protein SO802_003851 [Lithocarpus litseifolius]|uniref:Uncharacterized protein n=1 Tax=Lithocarpus litseifolius TaxID=425828 RepID=A0AAW2E1U3_9ROSI